VTDARLEDRASLKGVRRIGSTSDHRRRDESRCCPAPLRAELVELLARLLVKDLEQVPQLDSQAGERRSA
jgi:hypothetical protein